MELYRMSMPTNKFSEDDVSKLVKLLNMINSHAEFTINQLDMIEYVRLLGYTQSTILPKMKANIFEVVRVAETPEAGQNSNE